MYKFNAYLNSTIYKLKKGTQANSFPIGKISFLKKV